MRNFLFFIICLFSLLSVEIAAQEEPSAIPLATLDSSEIEYFKKLVDGNNRFAFDFYRHLKNQPGNLYFSPYALMAGLGLVAVGTKGETENQFQKLFYYRLPLLLFIGDFNAALKNASAPRNAFHMLVVNALWIDSSISILSSFKQLQLRNFYLPERSVDFTKGLGQTIDTINQWIATQANQKVGNTVLGAQDVSTKTRMLLTTAAFLEGTWMYPFDPKNTKRLPFHVTEFRSLSTDMMENRGTFLTLKGEKCDILALPFLQGEGEVQAMMMILLPKKGLSLGALEDKLEWKDWQQWKKSLQSRSTLLTLPRFRIEKRLVLEAALKGLGLTKVFAPSVDFSGMTEAKNLALGQVLQKCSFEVDEKGVYSEAMEGKRMVPPMKEMGPTDAFIADRPFIFMIWDQKSDAILSMGRLAYP